MGGHRYYRQQGGEMRRVPFPDFILFFLVLKTLSLKAKLAMERPVVWGVFEIALQRLNHNE
jgi:hypothetical protein